MLRAEKNPKLTLVPRAERTDKIGRVMLVCVAPGGHGCTLQVSVRPVSV